MRYPQDFLSRVPQSGDAAANLVPHHLYMEQTVAAATIGAAFVQPIGSRDFLWTHIGFHSAYEGLVSIRDTGTGEQFTSDRINTRSIVGNQLSFFRLPLPWLFLANSQVECVYENLDAGNGDTMKIVLRGLGVPSSMALAVPSEVRRRRWLPYFLQVFGAAVTHGTVGSTTPSKPVGSRDFHWTHLGLHAPATISAWKVFLRDVGSGEAFMNARTDAESIVGQDHYPQAFGWKINGKSGIYADVENNDSADDLRFDVTAIGYTDRETLLS
jgi:hypothetical protein